MSEQEYTLPYEHPSQRDAMSHLRKQCKTREELIAVFAQAMDEGSIPRKKNKYLTGSFLYATQVYADGVGKGWLMPLPYEHEMKEDVS